MQTKRLYKVPKKAKLENNKKRREKTELEQNTILETKPTPAVAPNLTQDKLIHTIRAKFNSLSDRSEKALEDALDAHSHIAQIANPVLRESCHELINAETHREIQAALPKVSELKKTIPTEEIKLIRVIEDYEALLREMISEKPKNTAIDADAHTFTTTPSIKLTMGG